jgi:hypothetical protein
MEEKRDAISPDYSQCPIPKTHRRLVEAHLLWHQTLAQYQEPEPFQANLNATIQALRNITFVLQSEKHGFSRFDDWYQPWQERMNKYPVLRWLKEARNTVVKQGELETTSSAIVKLVTWKDDVLAESSIPPGAPPSLILRNLPIFELLNNTHVSPGDLESAAIVIERRWSVPDLEGREILEELAQAYGLLSDVVLDAHINLGKIACISQEGTHVHFRSTYHRSGTLACMVLGVEHRTHSFKLSTGQQLQSVGTISLTGDPAVAAKRYGLGQSNQMSNWEALDPLLCAERVLYAAKRMLRKDRTLIRVLFIRDGRGTWHLKVINAANRTEKHLLIRMVARFIESVGGDAIIDVGEAWMLPLKDFAPKTPVEDIRHANRREETVQVLVATREGFIRTYITPFTRGPLGGIKIGDTVKIEKGHPNYLKPVLDVWRTQGARCLPDGKRIKRLWEPDLLDTCFCGGPLRFAECCKLLLDRLSPGTDIQVAINKALTVRDFTQYEKLARAGLAQYVIWVKQHSAPAMHIAPKIHRMWVEVDVPALTAHVQQLCAALEANVHSELLVPQLRHISRIIAVPELSIRLTVLVAQWLFESGDFLGAIKEMESLGNPDNLNDALGLVLTTKLFDLLSHKQRQFLIRAVSSAFLEDERLLAEFELIRHLFDCGEQAEALKRIDKVIVELTKMDRYRDLRAEAISLRWYVTKEEEAFRAARVELESFTDQKNRQHLAAILIDHGDYDEAEEILSAALTAADPMAQFLIIDARVRANRLDSARELLLSIPPECVPTNQQYPYAVACALVALACTDDDLKKLAATKLRQLQSIGTARMAKHANDFLGALEGHDDTRRKSSIVRFCNLFTRLK